MVRWEGHVTRMGEMRNAYKLSIGNTEWKRPIRRKILKMGLQEIGYEVMDCTKLAQNNVLVNTAMNLRFP
jgi:hypothetical protein